MNIFMLTAANLRKNKGQAISLLIFVLMAAMLLYIGLTVLFGISNFFDERAEAVNAAHFVAIHEPGAESIESGRQFMANHPNVMETETSDVVGGMGQYFFGDISLSSIILFSRVDRVQRMDPPSLIGESLPLTEDAIYIPNFLMLSNAHTIGDAFNLEFMGTELSFTIAGATEEITFGTDMMGIFRFYIPDERFEELYNEFSDFQFTLEFARLYDKNDAVFFLADFDREVSTNGLFFHFLYENAKQARLLVPTVVATILTAFAVIILGVSLIVIRFRIVNSIEENMTNIGALKALGYKSNQIIFSKIIQFGIIAVIGSIIGILISQLTVPFVANIFRPMLALTWTPGFDLSIVMISMLIVIITVILISYLASLRIKKLAPLTALRRGISTHNFNKNVFPLERTSGPLNLLLALKFMIQNKKQAVTVSIIVAAVTMMSIACISISHVMNNDHEAFANAFFGERPDIAFILNNQDDFESFVSSMQAHTEVRKVFGLESSVTANVDGTNIVVTAVEDTDLLEVNTIISGRNPRHNNEIALGTALSRVSGASVGDTVTVTRGDYVQDYIVTGISQIMQDSGFTAIMTGDGLTRVMPEFGFIGVFVYLIDGVDVQIFIDNVTQSDNNVTGINVNDQLTTTMDSMSGIFALVATGVLILTSLIVTLVLYLVIKTMILRRRRELGIQKAVGFTTLELMNQIALNMTPIILIGVVVGAIAGYFGFNPITVALMSGMGIVQLNLPVPILQTIMVCAALTALAYLVSMLISWRIRKISAYSLITE